MRRIQRKRERGWRKPPGAVYIGRPSVYGNPFDWQVWGRALAVEHYRWWLHRSPDGQRVLERARRELAGKTIMCWCPEDEPCHGDVLIDALAPIPEFLSARQRIDYEQLIADFGRELARAMVGARG